MPASVKALVTFHFVEHVEDVIRLALTEKGGTEPRRHEAREETAAAWGRIDGRAAA